MICVPIVARAERACSSSAISRSDTSAWNIRHFQPDIDRGGGVRQRADGNEIDSRGCHTLHVFQCDAAACFKLDIVPSQRQSFPNLRRSHIVEEDNIYALYLDESADLFKVVRFYFDADIRPFPPEATNSIRKGGEPSESTKMIILYKHHVVQAETVIDTTTSNDSSFF